MSAKHTQNGDDPAMLLHIACARRDDGMIKLLLMRGCSVRAEDAEGRTPRDLCQDEETRQVFDIMEEIISMRAAFLMGATQVPIFFCSYFPSLLSPL